MRVLVLFTGKGGVGKTTAAAATAALLAARVGQGAGRLHRPGALAGRRVRHRARAGPTEVEPGLGGHAGGRAAALRGRLGRPAGWLGGLLRGAGLDGLAAESSPVPPGAAEVLRAAGGARPGRARHRGTRCCVDCAPTAETLRLLALPEALAGYLERAVAGAPAGGALARPVLGRLAGEPVLPPESVLDAPGGCRRTSPRCGRADRARPVEVRLVLTPEAGRGRRGPAALTALALHGYAVDSVIANRVLPPEAGRSAWARPVRAAQRGRAGRDRRVGAGGCRCGGAPYRPPGRSGRPRCSRSARRVYGPDDPLAPGDRGRAGGAPTRDGGTSCCGCRLPFVRRSEVRLAPVRRRAGGHRRRAAAPAGRCRACCAAACGRRGGRGRRGPGPVPPRPGALAAGGGRGDRARAAPGEDGAAAGRGRPGSSAAVQDAVPERRRTRAPARPARPECAGARCAARSPCCGVTARR